MQILKKYQCLTRLLLANKSYKYFTGYLHNDHKVKTLDIMLPKTRTFIKLYDRETKWMYFLIEDGDLLEKDDNIWNKASDYIKR